MSNFWTVYGAGVAAGWLAHLLLVRGLARLRDRRELEQTRAELFQVRAEQRHRRSVAARKGWERRRVKSAAEFRGFVDHNFDVKQTTPFPPVDVAGDNEGSET